MPSRVPRSFADLKIPLAVVATDFYAQDTIVFSDGDLRQAIAASIALPVIFQPVIINNRALVDGGLVDPLPYDLATGKADVTVAIDVSGAPRSDPREMGPGAVEAIVACSQILQRSIVREKLKRARPDVYIDVDVDAFHVLEFHRFREILAAAQPAKESAQAQARARLRKPHDTGDRTRARAHRSIAACRRHNQKTPQAIVVAATTKGQDMSAADPAPAAGTSTGAGLSGTPTVALALGGGSARGLAHIAILEAFDELGIKPTVIVGTSIGAIVGACYAAGLSAREIREHAAELLRAAARCSIDWHRTCRAT